MSDKRPREWDFKGIAEGLISSLPRFSRMRSPLAKFIILGIAGIIFYKLQLSPASVEVQDMLASQPQAHPQATALDQTTSRPFQSHRMDCGINKAHLQRLSERYELNERFEYLKRYVHFERKPIHRRSITKLDHNFLPHEFQIIDDTKAYKNQRCPDPLEVPVPESSYPSTANATDFIFGVSTTMQRFSDPATSPVREWKYWLTDGRGNSNGGKVVVLLTDASDSGISEAQGILRDAGIDAEVVQSESSVDMAVRYLSLVVKLLQRPGNHPRKWLVLIDDDTFFPSMNGLVSKMAEFDHTRPMYIGALSEDFHNVMRHGSQAFGGAGVFLSGPMAEVLAKNFDDCTLGDNVHRSDSGWGPQGDILLRQCIYDNSDVRLTNLWDLWQLDITGDPAGFYESGIKPLSLHHYRGSMWHVAHPLAYTKIASTCGEDCPFQRFQTADNFILSTFSVARYPEGIDFDLNQMERTFSAMPDDAGSNLDYMFGPQRPSLHQSGRKIAWELQEADLNEDGSVVQVYTRKANDERFINQDTTPMSDVDGLLELVWVEKPRGEGRVPGT